MRAQQSIPHFVATTLDGRTVRYVDVWQHTALVLILVADPASHETADYLGDIAGHMQVFRALGAECVITAERVEGLAPPAVVIADRWGEIVAVAEGDLTRLPDGDAIVEWLEYLQHRCPECEGEAR